MTALCVELDGKKVKIESMFATIGAVGTTMLLKLKNLAQTTIHSGDYKTNVLSGNSVFSPNDNMYSSSPKCVIVWVREADTAALHAWH